MRSIVMKQSVILSTAFSTALVSVTEVQIFIRIATIGSPEYRSGRFFSEAEPFDIVLQRFQRGGLEFTMTMPVKKVMLGTTK